MLPCRPGRPVRALVAALFLALAGAVLPAGVAHAESRTVQGGRLDWGIKSSFQSYVTGPIAHGSWKLTGGAATVGGSQYRFHSASGSYDPDTGAFTARFAGGVHFLGHRAADGSHALDLAISRPTVRISGGSGTLYADMTNKAKGSGKTTTSAQVPLASLDLSGIDMRGGGSPIGLSGIPATLTSRGATAFAGYYPAGTALDPVTLSVDVRTAAPARQPSQPASPRPQLPEATAARPPQGAFRDAAVDWGIRRTFREYVTGPIAKGSWVLGAGAQNGGALFRFPRGKGTYDPGGQTLDADFTGTVRFTGTGLDLTLGRIAVTVRGGRGSLSADVRRDGRTDRAVPLITFPVRDFAAKSGLAVVTEAPATLTAEGAKAFGSLYKAGTAMDPVSLAVALDAQTRLPALPDLGSDTATSAPKAKATAPAESSTRARSSSGTGALTVTGIGAGVLIAAAIAGYAVRRRTRAGTTD
ncbi:HtaA domain-containing protein [Streptomyces sp. NPDC127084]|uniref:HtaA domain-containing protein n=1 Tax=Streptomyces sp. NPDC127084 TaxID=3347133 RepID=UPI00365E83A5